VLILQKKTLLSLDSEKGCKRSFATVHVTSIAHLCTHWHLLPHQFREKHFNLKEPVIQPLKEKNPGLLVTTRIKKSAAIMAQVCTKLFLSLPQQKGRELTVRGTCRE